MRKLKPRVKLGGRSRFRITGKSFSPSFLKDKITGKSRKKRKKKSRKRRRKRKN